MEVKFKVKNQTGRSDFKVRFSFVALDTKYGFQGATVCVLEHLCNHKGVYSGVSLLHPNEYADEWIGYRKAFERAVNNFANAWVFDRDSKRMIATKMWNAFLAKFEIPKSKSLETWTDDDVHWENEYDFPHPGELYDFYTDFKGMM